MKRIKAGWQWLTRGGPAWAVAVVVALAVNALIALGLAVGPQLSRGWGQEAGSYVDVVCTMLKVPGVAFVWAAAGAGESFAGWQAVVAWVANVAFWLVGVRVLVPVVRYCMGWRVRAFSSGGAAEPSRRPSPGVSEEGEGTDMELPRVLPTRRRFLAGATQVVAAGVGGVGVYSMFVEPRAFGVRRYEVGIEGLPAELDGLVVAQLTDLHHCSWIPLSYIRRVVDATNALGADLVVLTGDYTRESPAYIRPVMGELARLRGRAGVVGTLGNHDWWEDAPLTQRCMGEAGIRVIDNGRVFVTPQRTLAGEAERGLCVAGVGDLWCDRLLYDRALYGVGRDVPRLLLSHNPDVAEERRFVSSGHRVDLMLSGHTHGGQVWLPGLGAPMTPSRYGVKYAYGLVQGPTTRVIVSAGVGISGLPVRLGARPEVVVVRLRSARAEG